MRRDTREPTAEPQDGRDMRGSCSRPGSRSADRDRPPGERGHPLPTWRSAPGRLPRLLALPLAALVAFGCAEGNPPEPRDVGATVEPTEDTSDATDAAETNDATVDAGPPEIVPAPKELVFDGSDGAGVPQGETQTIEVDLQNNGASTATVDDLAIQGDEDSEFSVAYPDGEVPFDVEAGVFSTIEVSYSPSNKDADRAQLLVNFRGTQLDELEIPLRTVNHYPDIDAPNSVPFGGVEPENRADKLVNVYNRGAGALEIEEISIPNDTDFSLEFPAAELDPTVTLQRDDTMQFRVVFAPTHGDRQDATIQIESNDPDQSTYEIGVWGNRPEPCMEVQSRSVDFGAIGSEEATREFSILNCNNATGEDLELLDVQFVTDGGGALSVRDVPELPETISPGQETSFTIVARLEEARSARGQLQVKSDDPDSSPVLVEVQAERAE